MNRRIVRSVSGEGGVQINGQAPPSKLPEAVSSSLWSASAAEVPAPAHHRPLSPVTPSTVAPRWTHPSVRDLNETARVCDVISPAHTGGPVHLCATCVRRRLFTSRASHRRRDDAYNVTIPPVPTDAGVYPPMPVGATDAAVYPSLLFGTNRYRRVSSPLDSDGKSD